VLVTFMDGDPDRPIVTGSVHNAEMGVPYPLPAEQTKSTIRGRSSGEGGPQRAALRGQEGEEEIYLHARKDLKETVKNARTTTIEEADDTLVVKKGHAWCASSRGTRRTR
jgi:type VI secretion system secreted protein VgrG